MFGDIPIEAIPFEFIFFLVAIVIIALIQSRVLGSRRSDRLREIKRNKVHMELSECRAKLKMLELGQASAAVKYKELTDYLIKNFKAASAISIINKCVGANDNIDLNAYTLYEKQKIEHDLGDVIKDINMSEEHIPKTRAGLLDFQGRLRDRLAEMELEKERLNNEIKELEIKEVILQ